MIRTGSRLDAVELKRYVLLASEQQELEDMEASPSGMRELSGSNQKILENAEAPPCSPSADSLQPIQHR